MKQLKSERFFSISVISGTFLILGWLMITATGIAQDKNSAAKMLAPGAFVLSVADGRLSLEANDASVARIFKELGQRAGIAVDLQTGSDEKISIKLDRVPLEDAIKRLSDNIAISYTQDPKDKQYKIAKIAVRLRGGETSGGLAVVTNTTPQTTSNITVAKGTAAAQTPRPEPFQFTFNP